MILLLLWSKCLRPTSPQNSYVENLMPKEMVLGGPLKVIKSWMEPSWATLVPLYYKRAQRTPLLLPPCEATRRRLQPSLDGTLISNFWLHTVRNTFYRTITTQSVVFYSSSNNLRHLTKCNPMEGEICNKNANSWAPPQFSSDWPFQEPGNMNFKQSSRGSDVPSSWSDWEALLQVSKGNLY